MERCAECTLTVLLIITIATVFIVILVVFTKSVSAADDGDKLVIDHDGGADDAMAIFLALLYEQYFDGPNVIALTTVHGNVDEPQVFINSQRILDVAQRQSVSIYRGSKTAFIEGFESDYYFGKDGLGDNATVVYDAIAAQSEQAALALINLSKTYEGQLSIVALGALTNIAMAIRLDSDFIDRLSQLYVGAGNVYSAQHPDAEFNAHMDVEAYHIVMATDRPEIITIVPFSQIMDYISITNEWRENVLGSIATDIVEAQNVFEQVSLPKSESWVLLDPATMAVALINTSFVNETSYSDNSINLCGDDRGINTNSFTSAQNATAKIVMAVDEDSYKTFLVDVFSASVASETKNKV